MPFEEDALVRYTEMVWSSVLGLETQRSHEVYHLAPTNVESCVQITGPWVGLVTISCPEPLAYKIAEIMFQLTPGSVGPEELQDALGEMANMIGGNIKSLLSPSCHLSLPIVAIGGHSLHFPMTQIVCKITMKSLNQLFQVTILKQKESRFSAIKYK